MATRAILIPLAAAALFAGGSAAWPAPITTNTALPVSQGEFILREKAVVAHGQDRLGGVERGATGVTSLTVLGYGINPDLAAFVILPASYRKMTVAGDQRDAAGIGDVSAFVRYTIFRKDEVGKTIRVAPFLGLKAPTGRTSKRDQAGTLPPNLQPGTGSWDIFGGVVATYATLEWVMDVQGAFRVNTRDQGRKVGNEYRADASFQYRLLPGKVTAATGGFLYGVLELNLVHRERSRVGAFPDPDTGGTTLYLVPGLQYAMRRWIAELAVQIPVAQDLNGAALERDFAVHTGIRVNF